MPPPMPARSYRQLFGDGLWSLVSFAVPYIVDTLIGTLILIALLWFAWLIGIGKAFGIKPEYLESFESAHFWMNYGVFVIVGLLLGTKMLRRLFRGE